MFHNSYVFEEQVIKYVEHADLRSKLYSRLTLFYAQSINIYYVFGGVLLSKKSR